MMENNMNTDTNTNTNPQTNSDSEFEDSENQNSEHESPEINRAPDTIVTIENEDSSTTEPESEPEPETEPEPKAKAKTKSKSKPKSKSKSKTAKSREVKLDEATLNFWHGFHKQLPKCGFGIAKRPLPFVRDVQMICRDGSLKVHRVVLIAASDLFREAFKMTDEENPVVHLLDWSTKEVKPVIDLFYRGQVLLPSTVTPATSELLSSLKIHRPNLNLNISPATAEDLIQAPKPFSDFKEENSVKFSALRILNPEKFPPAAVLNEFCPKLEFLYENRTGVDRYQQPGFVVKAFFQHTNKTYSVRSSCKKSAKNKCAAQILNDLGIQLKLPGQNPSDEDAAQPQVENGESAKRSALSPEVGNPQKPKNNKKKKPYSESLESSSVSMDTNDVYMERSVVERIINIPNLQQNAWAALSNVNGSQRIQTGFMREARPPYYIACRLRFNFTWFYGTGLNEKDARARAAFQALLAILGPQKLKALCERSKTLPVNKPPIPVPIKSPKPKPSESQNPAPLTSPSSAPSPASVDWKLEELDVDQKVLDKITGIANLDRNAYIAINSLNTAPVPVNYEYQLEENPNSNSSARFIFVCTLKFEDREFIAQGESKTKARDNVGREALLSILGPKTYQVLLDRSKTLKKSEKPPIAKREPKSEPEPEPERNSEQEPVAEDAETFESAETTPTLETSTEIETETENFLNDMLENYG